MPSKPHATSDGRVLIFLLPFAFSLSPYRMGRSMWNLQSAEREGVISAVEAAETVARLQAAIERVIRGKPEAVRLAIVALLAGGHLLVEDVPGVGKTTLAQALAQALDCTFQ